MGGERSMGGKGAHLGDLGWPAGRGSSRGRAGRRRRVDDEQDRRRASRGRAGDELGRAGEEQRSRTGGEEVVRRDGPRPARRTGGGDDQILRGDERMAPRSLLILPRLGLVAAREFLPRSDLARKNWPPSSSRSSRAPTRRVRARLALPPRRLAPRCATMPLVAATGFAQRLGARSRRVVAA